MGTGWGEAHFEVKLGAKSLVSRSDLCGYLCSIVVGDTICAKAAGRFRWRKGKVGECIDSNSASELRLPPAA